MHGFTSVWGVVRATSACRFFCFCGVIVGLILSGPAIGSGEVGGAQTLQPFVQSRTQSLEKSEGHASAIVVPSARGLDRLVSETDSICRTGLALQELSGLAAQKFQHIGEAFEAAAKLFPNDPVSRGVFLRQKLGDRVTNFVVDPERSFYRSRRRGRAYGSSLILPPTIRVRGRTGHVVRGMFAVPSAEMNAIMYISRKDAHHEDALWPCIGCDGASTAKPVEVRYRPFRPREAAKWIVNARHGWTGLYSQGYRKKGVLDVMNASAKRVEPSEQHPDRYFAGENVIAARLVEKGLFFQSVAVAVDHPFHGSGPGADDLMTLKGALDVERASDKFLAKYGKYLLDFSRSGSTMTAAQRNFEYGEENPLDAMIWMAPVHPFEGLDQALMSMHDELTGKNNDGRSTLITNPRAMKFFHNMVAEMSGPKAWYRSANPLGKKPTPTLILWGEHDKQTPPATRAWFREFARQHPDVVEAHEIKGAGHDVIATTETFRGDRISHDEELSARDRATVAWEIIYRFLAKHYPDSI